MAGHRHPCGLRFHETGIHDFGSTGKLFFVAEDPGSEGGNVFIGNLIVCVEYNNVAFTCDRFHHLLQFPYSRAAEHLRQRYPLR